MPAFYSSKLTAFMAIFFSGLLAYQLYAAPSLSSSSRQRPNAIKISDPCPLAWQSLPDKYKKKLKVGGVSLNVETLFMSKCNEYRDQLINQAKKPLTDIKAQAQAGIDAAKQQAHNSFLSWVAEKFRDKILPTLPPEVRAKYDPNSPLIQAKAQEWLNQPGQEISTYVNEYIATNAPTLGKIISTYGDLTAGESAQIISGMKAILQKAQARLSKLTAAKQEIEANPDVPYSKILKKYGFSGEWIDKFRHYEGKINAFNAATNMKDVVFTTVAAFQTNDPKVKIEKMFDIMDSLSAAASDSKIPIVSLMGDIVNSMAQVAKQMLQQVNALGEVLKKRAGYCVGTGAPGDDIRSQILDKRGILACPLAHTTLPWKHIYSTVEPEQGLILFWDGSKFIDGIADGGSKAGVQQAIKLMSAAKALGYQVKTNDINSIAKVYNTPGGIPKLMKEAQRVMSDISKQARQLEHAMSTKGKCSRDDIIKQVESMTGLNLKQFLDEINTEGQTRLITTFAASYVAKNGGFGDAGGKRANAYDRYKKIWEKIKDIQLMVVDGEVRSKDKPNASCSDCANAIINAKVRGGKEVSQCEVWQADSKGNFVMHIVATQAQASVSIYAAVKEKQSEKMELSLKPGNQFIKLLVDLKKDEDQCDEVSDLLNKSRNRLNAGKIDEANAFLNQAKAMDCDKLKPDIDKLSDDINKEKADQNKVKAALDRCNSEEIQALITNPETNAEQKKRLSELAVVIEKANQIINPDISSDAQLKDAINQHETVLTKILQCGDLHQKVSNSLNQLKRLEQTLAEAKKAEKSCNLNEVSKSSQALLPFNQSLAKEWLSKLKERSENLKTADTEYENAKGSFRKGQAQEAMTHLVKAKTSLEKIKCPTDKIDRAISKVKQMDEALKDPQKALQSCSISIINNTLLQIKGKAAYSKLQADLLQIKSGINSYQKAGKAYLSGNLDQSEGLLKNARANVLGFCPELNNRIDNGLKKIMEIKAVHRRIKQAISNCDMLVLKSAQQRLAGKVNAYLKALSPEVNNAIQKCQQDKTLIKPSIKDGHPVCKKEFGEGAYAVAVNPNGTFQCQCRGGYRWRQSPKACVRQTIKDGHERCKKEFGRGAYAIAINENGTYQCQCRAGFQWNSSQTECIRMTLDQGHQQCKKEFGSAAYAIAINPNGTYQCQCKAGYQWNSSQTHCRRISIKQGHRQCRKEFGNAAYAIAINPNGSYQCQCKAGYVWNSNKTHCRRMTKRDGHKICKSQFGRHSHAIRYIGNGRWSCYDPRKARCPAGYYRTHQGRCLPMRPRSCPPGYHRPPGGGACHRS